MRRLVLSALAAALLVPAALNAQKASYTYFAHNKNCHFNERLQAIGVPKLGNIFKVQIPTSWCSQPSPPFICFGSILLTAGSRLRKPFNTALLSVRDASWCGLLYIPPDLIFIPPVTKDLKPIIFSFGIPNDRRFLGRSFYQQVIFWYGGIDGSGRRVIYHALSRAGHGVIGR